MKIDIDAIARESGWPEFTVLNMSDQDKARLSRVAALVLEKAADVIRDECLSGNQAENELRAMSAALQSGDRG